MGDERIILGKFGRPHGREGKVRLWLYNDETEVIRPGANVRLEHPDGPRNLVVDSVQPRDRFVIVGIKEIEYRDQAEELNHLEISVERSRLPEPEEGEFYGSDLIGFDVLLHPEGEGDPYAIGVLEGFLDNVDTDVMIITGPRIKGRWLVAFTFDSVDDVDVEAERIVLHPLEAWAHEDQVLLPE